jgi:thioredoxin-related protein
MRKFLIYVVLVFSTSLFASGINWAKDFNSGVKEATAKNKPVLFVFSRHSCKYCVMLEETTFKDKQVIEELNKDFVSIVAYSDERDYFPRELWRPGTPTLWFLDAKGEPMFQPLVGAVDAANFLKAVDIVKKEFDSRQKAGKK